jgi:predicted nucleic acid-binding protein
MIVTFFVDSNVLIYTRDQLAPRKRERAVEWLAAIASRGAGVISPQVLNESIRAFIDKLDLDTAQLRFFVVQMSPWCTASIDPAVIERAVDVRDRWKFAWWDRVIVASALSARCQYLLTEDLQDGQTLEEMTVLNPFSNEPSSFFPA